VRFTNLFWKDNKHKNIIIFYIYSDIIYMQIMLNLFVVSGKEINKLCKFIRNINKSFVLYTVSYLCLCCMYCFNVYIHFVFVIVYVCLLCTVVYGLWEIKKDVRVKLDTASASFMLFSLLMTEEINELLYFSDVCFKFSLKPIQH